MGHVEELIFRVQTPYFSTESRGDFGLEDYRFWILDFGFWILDFGFWIDIPYIASEEGGFE
jgi:hypothetical protein